MTIQPIIDKYPGVDNHKRPRAAFIASLAVMADEDLQAQAEKYIWLSAHAANNPRSDYHWMCDAVYDVLDAMGKVDIYKTAHASVSESV